jgi:heat-inducible transcriptional repressor
MNTWTEDVDLTARERAVLACVVELYVGSGAPVASRQIVASSGLDLSSATIRSIVAGLESNGLLTRPHASAGSLPTDRGYRTFVDSLSVQRDLPVAFRRQLEARIFSLRRELVEDLEWVAQVAADLTQEAGVAMRPIGEQPVVEAVSLVPLGGRRALGVIVTTDGAVDKRVIAFDDEPRAESLQEESSYLTTTFRGAAPEQIRRWIETTSEPDAGLDAVARRAAATARQLFAERDEDVEVQFAGTDRLLQSAEFTEADRIRSLLSALHDRRRMASEWRRALDKGPTQVIIGRESEVTASGNLGMVATLFFKGGRRAGAVGVVGPRRMNYGRIVPVVKFIGDALTRMLEEPGASHA